MTQVSIGSGADVFCAFHVSICRLRSIMLFLFMLLEIKQRVDAMWEQMNKGVSSKTLKALSTKPSPPVNKNSNKPSNVKIHILLFHNEAGQKNRKQHFSYFILSPCPPSLELDFISWYGVKQDC